MFSLTKSDGLLNFGFSRNAAFRTSTGEILLGSRDGFTIIKKNSRTDSQYNGARIKAVEKIICNGEEIPINDKGQAKLKHHQNSFHISVIDIDPHTVATGKSLFCMVGHDHTWVPAGNDRKLSYLNLKPGKYFFKAYNNLIEPVWYSQHGLNTVFLTQKYHWKICVQSGKERELSDEVSHHRFLLCWRLNTGSAASLDTTKHPCHVSAKLSHDLHSFLILTNLVRSIAMYHIPIL